MARTGNILMRRWWWWWWWWWYPLCTELDF